MKRKTVLMGDINVDNLVASSDNDKLEELLSSFDFVREGLPPTRITAETAKSIDWICTNIDTQLFQTAVITSGLSDHTAQTLTLMTQMNHPTSSSEKRRIFNKHSMESFKLSLQHQNWDSVFSSQDANQAYNNFYKILQLTLNNTCPQKILKRKPYKKQQCWDAECMTLKNAYIQALERELCSGRAEDKTETVTKKKEYDQRLKLLKRQQTMAHIEKAENKSKALWQVINNERNAKAGINNEWKLLTNNKTIQDPMEVANCFNNFFATVADRALQGNSSNPNHPQQFIPANTNSQFHFHPVTRDDIKKAIDSLKPKTSSGIDEISAKLIKNCKEELDIPLTDITNKSLQQGIFPELLKIAKVYPLHKNGETTNIGNYRPISLIPTFSKIIEKIVLSRLLLHLEQNSLLTSQQHGFLKGRSTATALIQLIEHIIDQLEEGIIVTSLFLDFSKAFDCLNHDRLLIKLRALGVTGTAAKWFHSYLNGRKQLVEIMHEENHTRRKISSELVNVRRGVPQGSVLGPVLYLLFTNDLPNWFQGACHTVMYADDTVISLTHKSAETLIRNTTTILDTTKQYCTTNQLVLNEKKTVQLTFITRNKKSTKVSLPGIESKATTKHLGVIIDSNLTWTVHIDHLCKKLSSAIYVVRRIKQISNLETAKTVYFALFESHLRYGIATWGGTTNANLERILIQQKRAVRCLAGLSSQESCREAFKKLKILTVVSLYIQEVILHAVSTEQLRHRDIHQHNTRRALDFTLPAHHLSLYGKKPSYKGALYFNHLPDQIKKEPLKHLKKTLNLWLQERPFYTESEFLFYLNN